MAAEQERESRIIVLPARPVRPGEAEAIIASLQLLPEPVWLSAIDGTILKANAPALELIEADEDELIGESVYSLGSMEPDKMRAASAHVVSGATIRFELEFLTLRGNRRRVDIINMPVVTATGTVERIIGFGRDISGPREAETEHALMAAMVESSGDAIMSAALDGTITSWNARAEKLFGFTQSEALGQSFLIIVPPETHLLARSMIRQIECDKGRVIHFEGSALRKGGSVVEISMTLFGIYNRSGNILGLSSILRDNTERKRAASEHALLAGIVNASEDAIISTSPENKILSWNRGAEKLFGIQVKEALGCSILTFIPPEEHGQVVAAVSNVSQSGKPVSFRLHSLRKDGTAFNSWINLFPTYDADGVLTAIGAIGRDISELIKAQSEQALLATIVSASQDAIYTTTPDRIIRTWNSGAEKLYGYSVQEARGKPVTILLAR